MLFSPRVNKWSDAVIWRTCTQPVAQERDVDHRKEMEEDKIEHDGIFMGEQ